MVSGGVSKFHSKLLEIETYTMKLNPKWPLFYFTIAALVFASCSKKEVCEFCNQDNKRPIAKAGKDTIIVLPADSIQLNGGSSSDPDGNIINYKWSFVPSSISASMPAIRNDLEKQTVATNLRPGIYRFALKVTDNQGAYSSDTVTVQIEDRVYPQHPVGFYPWVYSGLSWKSTATGSMTIGPIPEWQFADAPEENDGSKWKIQLVQQSTNTATFLPYVKYDLISPVYQTNFYSIWDLQVIYQGENSVGSVYVFSNPALAPGIDFSKPIDVIIYLKF